MTHGSLHSQNSKEQTGNVRKETRTEKEKRNCLFLLLLLLLFLFAFVLFCFLRNGHEDKYVGTNTETL